MGAALALARRGLGRVAPNPAVGCVLVKEDRVIGRGWTQPGGRPHAETEALARAGAFHGAAAAGATAYITLEPCSHFGKTPPCVEAMIRAGLSRCVVSLEDPDSRVSGRGLERLREAGIAVESGLLAEEAAELNGGYLTRLAQGRPLVTLKLATSLDGKIATEDGDSRWITGEAARRHVHLSRAEHDAVMVGSGTVLADNPRLDVRLSGLETASPWRIVADGRLRLPLSSDLVTRAAELTTLLITRDDRTNAELLPYRDAGIEVLAVPADQHGDLSLSAALQALAGRGVTRLMVEGGSRLSAALLRLELVDRIHWYRAPCLVGGEGLASVAELGITRMADSLRFRSSRTVRLGEDLLEILVRAS